MFLVKNERVLYLLFLTIASLTVPLEVGADTPPITTPDNAIVEKSGTIIIDVLANDNQDKTSTLNPDSLTIVSPPTEGIANLGKKPGTIKYRHAGTSEGIDNITYSVANHEGQYSKITPVFIAIREVDASVKITYPVADAVIEGNTLTIKYTVEGADHDHLHVTIDNQPHISISDLTGYYIFKDIEPGLHTVYAQLSNHAHQAIRIPSAQHSVTFTVK